MDRLRRSQLYVPGNSPAQMVNVGAFGADCVVLDLEDSVSPAEKDAARILVRNALRELRFGRSEKAVRINAISTGMGVDDLREIVPAGVETVLIPKVETAEDVRAVCALITDLGGDAGVIPIVETARGLLNAREIAHAEGVVGLTFGGEDLIAEIGATRTGSEEELLFARQMVLYAARDAGVQALDTICSDVMDREGLFEATQKVARLGFDGKGAIHPAQVPVIHRAFRPTPEEIGHALEVMEAMERAEREGHGVASVKGKMVDRPIVFQAKRILARARAEGLLDGGDRDV